MIGETLNGRYYILSLLGSGRCGQTYLAEDRHTKGTRCVVKQFEPEAKDTLSLRKAKYLFAREVKILKILGQSDRIPDLLDYFRRGEKFYLIHQFVEGKDLARELGAGRQWSAVRVLALLKEILKIVEVVHAQKVIHQDIKPSNIIRRNDGKLMLVDFGSVKKIHNQMANAEGNTTITVPIGTTGYMSPEQRSFKPELASDIYSVGAIALYALTGVEPKDIPQDRNTEIRWHSLASVEPKFAKILDRMVCSDFTRRYSSASEALRAIDNFKFGSNSFNLKTAIGASAIFLAMVGAGYYYWRLESSLTPPKMTLENDSTQFPFSYRNDANGVEMKYPADWKLAQPMQEQGVIAKLTPESNDSYPIAPEVSLEVEPTPQKSPEEYTINAVYQITQLPQAKIIDSYPTNFAGGKGHKIIYTALDPDNNLEQKYLQIWTLKGDRAYTATYQAATKNFQDFAETVENKIFETINIAR